jgi:cobalamin biosynthesis protein CbiG
MQAENTEEFYKNNFVIYNSKKIKMSKAVKTKIYQLLEGIEDETILKQVMEEVAFYATKKDTIDELSSQQLKELDKAIEEADNKETISWNDFKREMNEWKKK